RKLPYQHLSRRNLVFREPEKSLLPTNAHFEALREHSFDLGVLDRTVRRRKVRRVLRGNLVERHSSIGRPLLVRTALRDRCGTACPITPPSSCPAIRAPPVFTVTTPTRRRSVKIRS